jgi:hypothetical protein
MKLTGTPLLALMMICSWYPSTPNTAPWTGGVGGYRV